MNSFKFAVFLALFFVASTTLGDDNGLTLLTGNTRPCEERCKETYSDAKTVVKSCETGCRLLAITDSLSPGLLLGTSDIEKTSEKCNESCKSSYGATKDEVAACQKGCSFMAPLVKKRKNNLHSQLEDFFGGGNVVFHQIHLPQVFGNQPMMTEDKNDNGFWGFSGGSFRNIFDRVNKMMRNAMDQMRNVMPGTGKLVIIKSGPGYHEERTYNLGTPDNSHHMMDSNEEDEHHHQHHMAHNMHEGEGHHMMNDMMAKENPLDRFFNVEDFEKVEPSKEVNNIDNGLFDVEIFTPYRSSRDRQYVVEPKLPEVGLKSRHIPDREEICQRDNLRWSDWVSCIHHKIGMPRWLTAATISLGIMFALWLCLVIPSNPPKQKMPKDLVITKEAMIKAKEAEANGGTVISVVDVSDLPPSYDDVNNLQVTLTPIPEEPEKVKLEDNSGETKA